MNTEKALDILNKSLLWDDYKLYLDMQEINRREGLGFTDEQLLTALLPATTVTGPGAGKSEHKELFSKS